MKRLLMMALVVLMSCVYATAQRMTDKLDRGLVAVKTDGGVFCSWRILGEEYYDVTYNIYRDGTKLNADPLKVSNFWDVAGGLDSKYTVSAVVRGKEQAQCEAVSVWGQNYLEITPDHGDLTSTYVPNDACMADVDGDGELEILLKFDNQEESQNSYLRGGWYAEYSIIEVMKLDGTKLWWVDCGPNMGDFQNNEQNVVAYDWDQDGKAEAVMRLEEGSVIHMADGSTYAIGADGQNGSAWTNYREPAGISAYGGTVAIVTGVAADATASCTADWATVEIKDGIVYVTCKRNNTNAGRNMDITVTDNGTTTIYKYGQKYFKDDKEVGVEWFTHYGHEYLVYMNGATGKPYQVMDYPLKRLEAGETDLNRAWGDGYGHRSTKHFFGAPYLDGRHPSIFLARGIYTRHKMIAYDVNPATHELVERWRWNNNTAGSPWYGQGYHNYAVADVDWDGRDEICFGSMVIDDNGHGLSTTGLGHGDAQHHGDFNPYVHGHEIYACNEDLPDNNYRDATTSKIYYRHTSGNDDGRSMMGNFSNDYPGCLGRSGHDTAISSVTNEHIPQDIAFDVNFRIYWDGDLLEETFNGTDTRNSTGRIFKPSENKVITTLSGSLTNNDTKATPCYQGDILGDWREEVVMRTKDNKIRIYTTTYPTEWRNYTLWHDMQYRQAMVWQMCGYNQPPHVSYFLGELEGITMAPPVLTMADRQEVADGGSIGSSLDDQQVLLALTNDATVSVADGAKPYIFIDNAPSWVQGHDNNDNITYEYFTHTLTGGAFTGDMRLVKQGDGTLVLPNVTETYTGATDVWAGTLCFDGTMQNSRVWLNRFAQLHSDGGKFMNGILMDYASILQPGGSDKQGTVETDSLVLGFGARMVFDAYADGSADVVKAKVLTIEKKNWQYGPKYLTPVIEIARHGQLPEGRYLLVETEKIEGSVEDFVLEGVNGVKAALVEEEGKIYLAVQAQRKAAAVTWDGGTDGIWDFANTENFVSADGEKEIFVTGDEIVFDDKASVTDVIVTEDVSPASLVFTNNEKNYTLSGDGSIIGDATLIKRGSGSLTIGTTNRMTGAVTVEEGTLSVSALANSDGAEYGNLGGVSTPIILSGGTLSIANTVVTTQPVKLDAAGGTLNVANGKTLTANGAISSVGGKQTLHKTGNGTLAIGASAKYSGALYIDQGTINGCENGSSVHQYPDTVVINGGVLKDPDNIYSYSSNSTTVFVPEGAKGTWTLDSRCDYKGKLLGKGELTVNVTSVRCNMTGDWSQFAGTITFGQVPTVKNYNADIQWNNSYGLPNATVTGTMNLEEKGSSAKSIQIGTVSGNAVFSGVTRITTDNIAATITRARGSNRNTLIEVSGALAITGAINVELKGTGKITAGEEIILWKAGSFSASSSVEINLPTLPAGLYWDTSELLQKEGKLKVTDTPTGIHANRQDEVVKDRIYNMQGMPAAEPLKPGLYIKNGKKVVIK